MKIRSKHLTVLFAVLAVVWGAQYVTSMNERGLEGYLKQIAEDGGVKLESISCFMNNKHGRSRSGWCRFVADPAFFERLSAALELKENKETAYHYHSSPEYQEGCYAQEWIRNLGYDGFSSDPAAASPLREGVAVYGTAKNMPMPGNTSSSFIRAFYSKTDGRVCIDLHYPYG